MSCATFRDQSSIWHTWAGSGKCVENEEHKMVFQEYIFVFQEAASLPSTNDNIGKGLFSLGTLESSVQISDESRWYLSIL